MTVLGLLTYLGIGEILATQWVNAPAAVQLSVSPIRALAAAASPMASILAETFSAIAVFVVTNLVLSFVVLLIGINRVRVWNPSRELRLKNTEEEDKTESEDKQISWKAREPKSVWSNPVLWREVCTWAYGRKVVVIRVAFFILFCLIAGRAADSYP